jgi:hypothetical protein
MGAFAGVDEEGNLQVDVKGHRHITKWWERTDTVQWNAAAGQWRRLAVAGRAPRGTVTLRLVLRYVMVLPGQGCTLAKLQGAQFEGLRVHLRVTLENLFAGAMAYMALSRPRDMAWLYLVGDALDWNACTFDVPALSFVHVLAFGMPVPLAIGGEVILLLGCSFSTSTENR